MNQDWQALQARVHADGFTDEDMYQYAEMMARAFITWAISLQQHGDDFQRFADFGQLA